MEEHLFEMHQEYHPITAEYNHSQDDANPVHSIAWSGLAAKCSKRLDSYVEWLHRRWDHEISEVRCMHDTAYM